MIKIIFNYIIICPLIDKPECRIERKREDGQDYVVCSAEANPKESDFTWTLKVGNDTFDQTAEMRDGKSYILLEDVNKFRTYICVTNNTIGFSSECELDVPGQNSIFKLQQCFSSCSFSSFFLLLQLLLCM